MRPRGIYRAVYEFVIVTAVNKVWRQLHLSKPPGYYYHVKVNALSDVPKLAGSSKEIYCFDPYVTVRIWSYQLATSYMFNGALVSVTASQEKNAMSHSVLLSLVEKLAISNVDSITMAKCIKACSKLKAFYGAWHPYYYP